VWVSISLEGIISSSLTLTGTHSSKLRHLTEYTVLGRKNLVTYTSNVKHLLFRLRQLIRLQMGIDMGRCFLSGFFKNLVDVTALRYDCYPHQ
jgi:hypothetical protein